MQFTDDERFDGLYLNVAQTTRGIEPLLDTVFSFLRRKTDFFEGPPGSAPNEGSAAAVAKVNEVLDKHVRIYEEGRRREAEQKREKAKKNKKLAAKKAKAKEGDDGAIELGADGFDASTADAAAEEDAKPEAAAPAPAAADEKPSPPKAKEDTITAAADATAVATPKNDDNDDDEQTEEDGGPPPVGNGGAVPGKYVWTQTLQEVNVVVPLHRPTRGRDLDVVISKNHLKVGLKADVAKAGKSSSGDGYIVDAPLTKAVIVDDSFWTVEDGTRLVINLQKLNQMEWWSGVCDGDDPIDITKIQPENSNLTDLDGETRQTVEKMMFDQRQKALGLPTADEQKKLDVIGQFQKQHPEMDFSNAKIT